ncbi:MAG: hypothetical protein N6V49_04105, partial [Serratia symbiotica]|nr:hypothetical protein [Serratia symbiotica]
SGSNRGAGVYHNVQLACANPCGKWKDSGVACHFGSGRCSRQYLFGKHASLGSVLRSNRGLTL